MSTFCCFEVAECLTQIYLYSLTETKVKWKIFLVTKNSTLQALTSLPLHALFLTEGCTTLGHCYNAQVGGPSSQPQI